MEQSEKDAIIKMARTKVALHKPKSIPLERSCVHHAFFLYKTLFQMGYNAKMKAGSAQFEAVSKEMDDGVSATHYSYIFEPEIGFPLLRAGNLPECHAWVEYRYRGIKYVVDATTCFLPKLVESTPIVWSAPSPPDYLWEDVGSVERRNWRYESNAALSIALQLDCEHLTMHESPLIKLRK